MPNEQHTWETGETITAEKLNNLEERAGGIVVIDTIYDEETGHLRLTQTWQEICDAMWAGKLCLVLLGDDHSASQLWLVGDAAPGYPSGYDVHVWSPMTSSVLKFSAETKDGYPDDQGGN